MSKHSIHDLPDNEDMLVVKVVKDRQGFVINLVNAKRGTVLSRWLSWYCR